MFLFGAALVVTLSLVAHFSGPARFIEDKLVYLEEAVDDYDLLFFGSSYTFRGVIPALFDEAAAEAGVPVRSYNAAMAAMRSHEADYLLRRVLAGHPKRLRWVVIELGHWSPIIYPDNRFTERAIQWHDPLESWLVLRSSWLEDAPQPTRFDYLVTHALHLGAHVLQLGRAAESVRAAFKPDEPTPEWVRDGGFRGYSEDEYRSGFTAGLRSRFLAGQSEYLQDVERLAEANAAPTTLAHFNRMALAQQVEQIRAAGAEPIYLLPPTPVPIPEARLLAAQGLVPNLVVLNDARLYPDLFLLEHRFDYKHVNREGAELFTWHLARQFVEIVSSTGPD